MFVGVGVIVDISLVFGCIVVDLCNGGVVVGCMVMGVMFVVFRFILIVCVFVFVRFVRYWLMLIGIVVDNEVDNEVGIVIMELVSINGDVIIRSGGLKMIVRIVKMIVYVKIMSGKMSMMMIVYVMIVNRILSDIRKS